MPAAAHGMHAWGNEISSHIYKRHSVPESGTQAPTALWVCIPGLKKNRTTRTHKSDHPSPLLRRAQQGAAPVVRQARLRRGQVPVGLGEHVAPAALAVVADDGRDRAGHDHAPHAARARRGRQHILHARHGRPDDQLHLLRGPRP